MSEPVGTGVPADGWPRPVHPDGWKSPSGYAHAMTGVGRIVAAAGQIGWDPETEQFATDDFAGQAAQALRNVVAVLAASGAAPVHVVRMTWFVTGREEYLASRKALGEAWRATMGRHYPAMTVVVVAGLLEQRAKIEIEVTAVVPA